MIFIEKEVTVFEINTEITYEYIDPKIELEQYILRLSEELNWEIDEHSIQFFFGIPQVLRNTVIKDMLEKRLIEKSNKFSKKPINRLKQLSHTNKFYLFSSNEYQKDYIYIVTDKGKQFINENKYITKRKDHTFYFVPELCFFISKDQIGKCFRDLTHKKSEALQTFADLAERYIKDDSSIYGLPENIIQLNSENCKIAKCCKLKIKFIPVIENKYIREWTCKYVNLKKEDIELNTENPYIVKQIEELFSHFKSIDNILDYIQEKLKKRVQPLVKINWNREKKLAELEISIKNLESFIEFIFDIKQHLGIEVISPEFNILKKNQVEFKFDNIKFKFKAKLIPKSSNTANLFYLTQIINKIALKYSNYSGIINLKKIIEDNHKDLQIVYKDDIEEKTIEEILQFILDIKNKIGDYVERNKISNYDVNSKMNTFGDAIRMINEWSELRNDQGKTR